MWCDSKVFVNIVVINNEVTEVFMSVYVCILKLRCYELLLNQISRIWKRRLNEEILKPRVLLRLSKTEHSGLNMRAERMYM